MAFVSNLLNTIVGDTTRNEKKFDSIDILDPVSYRTIRNTLYEWRRSGGHASNFNKLDQPGHLFFKVVFHFWNGDAYGTDDLLGCESGLLTPAWVQIKDISSSSKIDASGQQVSINSQAETIDRQIQRIDEEQKKDNPDLKTVDYIPFHNSAYTFLLRNDELERAEKLKQFIMLLSNISTYSPWYFSEIAGLDAVMERPFKQGEEHYKIEATPKQINIKCLPDAMDERVATMLDLYRDVAYSHVWHREVLPANLRKFDMSIYIFSSEISRISKDSTRYGIMMDRRLNNSEFPVSYKRIELHDCEIDYNAIKTGYSGLNNIEGFQQTFEIPISVGIAFEHRYNTFIDRTIGDIVAIDMVRNAYQSTGRINTIFADRAQETNEGIIKDLNDRLSKSVEATEKNPLLRHALGNIYRMSLNDIMRRSQSIVNNEISKKLRSFSHKAEQLIHVGDGWFTKKKKSQNNIYSNSKEASYPNPMGSINTQDLNTLETQVTGNIEASNNWDSLNEVPNPKNIYGLE